MQQLILFLLALLSPVPVTENTDSATKPSPEYWTEIIQRREAGEWICRWERHHYEPVVSIGQWHHCTDLELGA